MIALGLINKMKTMSKETQDNQERTELIQRSFKDPVLLAMYMLQDNPSLIDCNEALYQYNGKFYDFVTDKDLDRMFQVFCRRYGITQAFTKVSIVIRAFLVLTEIKRVERMNDYPNMICLNNGILNIHTKEFIPHSEEYYFDSCVNVDYDPDAKECPNFVKFLDHTFCQEQDTIANIIRLGGYLLDTSNAAKKMFMFDGNGASGKSTLIDTFSMFFTQTMDARNQVTSLSLEQIASGSFDKECLITSRFNQCAETKGGQIDSEEIKKIVTGDIITVSRKFKTPVNFRPKAKIIVACNGLPTFNDKTDGIYRRLIIVPFKNQYKSQFEYDRISHPEVKNIYVCDVELMDKIREEKSAILNLFIEGLLDLKKNKYQFVESASSMAAIDEFKLQSDTVRDFLVNNYELDLESEISINDIYIEFKVWYRQNVQDYGPIKLRASELAKRIKDVYRISSHDRKYFANSQGEYQRHSMIHLRPTSPKGPQSFEQIKSYVND